MAEFDQHRFTIFASPRWLPDVEAVLLSRKLRFRYETGDVSKFYDFAFLFIFSRFLVSIEIALSLVIRPLNCLRLNDSLFRVVGHDTLLVVRVIELATLNDVVGSGADR